MTISELPSLEKQAWFHLGILAATILAWGVLFGLTRSASVAMAAMAILAATGIQPRKQILDERDRAIDAQALSLAVRCWFVLSAIGPIAAATYFGWDTAVSLSTVAQGAWLAWLIVLFFRSTATIYMYRWPKP